GIFRVAFFSNLGFTVVLRTGWKLKEKLGERYWISVSEVCYEPPILQSLFFGRGVHVEIPSILVEEGEYKGAIIACLDTTGLKLRGKASLQAFDKTGFVFGYVSIGNGVIKAELEWKPTVIDPTKYNYVKGRGTIAYSKRELIILEICVKSHFIEECKELVELNAPGKAKSEFVYPLTRKILLGDISGESFKEMNEIADKFEGVLGVKRAKIRIKHKSRLKARVLSELPLDKL
ncbi:MAG: hypothetical protein QXW94_04860, partial [Desulfurococcaceae archaeon]